MNCPYCESDKLAKAPLSSDNDTPLAPDLHMEKEALSVFRCLACGRMFDDMEIEHEIEYL